jgi:hypothetical protein
MFLSKFDSDGNFQWAGTVGGYVGYFGVGVAIGRSGNVYVIRQSIHPMFSDAHLAKYSPDGVFLWGRTWGGEYSDIPCEVATDDSGNVYVVGYFQGTTDFDPGDGADEHTSIGSWDAFLSKFDSDGDYQWAHTWGGDHEVRPGSVAVDNYGDVFVTGLFWLTADFDPGPGIDNHSSNGEGDIFLCKFNPNGDLVWANSWGGPGSDQGVDTCTDAIGHIYVTGYYEQTVDFDPGSGSDLHTSNGTSDAFLAKFDPAGGFKWELTWGGSDILNDIGYGVCVDCFRNAFVTGQFTATVDFNPISGVDEQTSGGSYDAFLCKFPPQEFWWLLE